MDSESTILPIPRPIVAYTMIGGLATEQKFIDQVILEGGEKYTIYSNKSGMRYIIISSKKYFFSCEHQIYKHPILCELKKLNKKRVSYYSPLLEDKTNGKKQR